MTHEEFLSVISNNPDLTTHGFGIDSNSKETFAAERAKLADCYQESLVCEEFLNLCKRTVKPHKELGSSYHFKHLVEGFCRREQKQIGDIQEGAFIVAAIHLGFEMMPKEGTTSVYLNISKKTKIHGNWIH